MAKKICKLVKDGMQTKKPEEFAKLVKKGEFFCKKCGHVANKKNHLCKPEDIK